METIFYTGRVELGASASFRASQSWMDIAENYQRRTLGNLTTITADNKMFKTMVAAGSHVYGNALDHTWSMGSLSNYIAMLEFLETSADRMVWLDLDLLRNMQHWWSIREGACITYPHAERHQMTDHERFKEEMFGILVKNPRQPYVHILSSLTVLSRTHASIITHGLNAAGLNLLSTEAWDKIRKAEQDLAQDPRWPRFFSDMIFELAHGICKWEPRNLFHTIDWYPTVTDRPLLHFHGEWKDRIQEFAETSGDK